MSYPITLSKMVFGYQGSGDDIAKSVSSKTNWTTSTKEGTPGNDPISNNRSGFSGLPRGLQYAVNQINTIGKDANWWIFPGTAFVFNISMMQ